ncbi:hypothetical protein [Streptomyces adelaidensis]|uniref:hypothetical protein n=1 Tax=Streptomyces adelaidensis TaxID=2796465 RepID=UPI001907E23A|nr:hypothetical protein [Streptomyces adelaidensis]
MANTCARTRLLVVMPDTGEHRLLERQPPLKGVLAPGGDVARDALFVSGEDPGPACRHRRGARTAAAPGG